MKSLLIFNFKHMYMKYISFSIYFFFFFFNYSFINAQQEPQFSHYVFNQLYSNPALAGIDENTSEISLLHRSQWVGYESTFQDGLAPTTQLATINFPFQFKENKLGMGLFFANDRLGFQTNMEIKLSLAYHIKMKIGSLSFGIGAGFFNQRIDFSKLRFREDGDPLDLKTVQNNGSWDYDLGIYYNSTYFFTGLSVKHIVEPDISFNSDISDILQNTINRHFNFIGGINIDASRDIQLTTSLLIKSNLTAYSFEMGMIADYRNIVYAGVSLREIESAIIMVGIYPIKKNRALKKLRIGYAFDYTIQDQRAKSPTSHEIILSYRIPTFSVNVHNVRPRTPRFRHE